MTISAVERFAGFRLPPLYAKFITDLTTIFEIADTGYCLYPLDYIEERNTTYEVKIYEPNALMIGQDGDLGIFIVQDKADAIFTLGLGALGSLSMQRQADDVFDFIKKIEMEEI